MAEIVELLDDYTLARELKGTVIALARYLSSVPLGSRPSKLGRQPPNLRQDMFADFEKMDCTLEQYMSGWKSRDSQETVAKVITTHMWEVPLRYRPIMEFEDGPKYGIEMFGRDWQLLDFYTFLQVFQKGRVAVLKPDQAGLYIIPEETKVLRIWTPPWA